MAVTAIRCPHCGGDVEMDPSLTRGRCPYCDSELYNGDAEEYSDRRSAELVAKLKMAKMAYASNEPTKCSVYIDEAMVTEPESSDAWFLKAALCTKDKEQLLTYRKKGLECKVSSGIFNVTDLDAEYARFYGEKIRGWKTAMFITVFAEAFMLGFISLGLGLGLETLIPAYITLGIVLVTALIFFICRPRKKNYQL